MRPLRATDKYTPEAFTRVHGKKYSYDKYVYVGAEKYATVTCLEHGDFETYPYNHLKGVGCPQCGIESSAEQKRHPQESYIAACREVHGDKYDYSKTVYTYARSNIVIICPEHGEFTQQADSHKRGRGCKRCADEARGAAKKKVARETFEDKARLVHNGFDYSRVVYRGNNVPVEIVCPEGHVFWQRPVNHLTGYGCSVCKISPVHKALWDGVGGEINVRGLLDNNQEIDLYFPDKKIGFEVNGVYWHTDKMIQQRREHGVARNYHQNKVETAAKRGIKLYHLWIEKDTNLPLLISYVRNKLGLTTTKIPARKAKIISLDYPEYAEFLVRTHLQGASNSSVRYGLMYEDKIVSVIGFKKQRDGWYLERFSSELDVVVQGGFSRLLKHFIREHTPEKIVTFSDDSYSQGDIYRSHGFEMLGKSTGTRLYYTDGSTLYHRQRFQRKAIARRRPDIPWGSELSMAEAEGFYPLHGCKTTRWEKSIPNGLK